MTRCAAGAAAAILVALSACTYHNSIYNAERLYVEAEGLRRAGRDSLSEIRYLDVIRKTGQAYRARPESEWAVDALFLLGRSRLRLGELGAAQTALTEAAARTSDAQARGEISVYLGIVLFELGDPAGAMSMANEALSGALREDVLAEAHLLRGRLLLAQSYSDQGLWDLDRASEVDSDILIEAGLERLGWGIRQGDATRTERALNSLLSHSEAGSRLDTIAALMGAASERWSPGIAATLMSGAEQAAWSRTARGRIALERSRLLHLSGDTTSASEQAWRIARGLGEAAAEARLLLARWHLERARDLVEAYSVTAILLPAGDDPRVADLIDAVETLELYTDIGLENPLGWFAAAEVARDLLGAHYVARGLFLAYADGAPDDPWAPKALLAAIDVSASEGDRVWLRGRLEAREESPYVLAAYGGPAAGFEALEEELVVRLRGLTPR